MKNDINYLSDFKEKSTDCLAANLHITQNQAIEIVKILEKEDLLKFEAPKYKDKPVSTIIEDKKLVKSNLGMTTRKVGNIIVNTYLDWRKIAGIITSSIETIAGTSLNNPFLMVVGIFSWLLSISSLTDIKINENGTAIIMVLQQHNRYQMFTASGQICMKEANEILVSNKYNEMSVETFQEELSNLSAIKCIDIIDDKIKLVEKVILHYY